LAKARVEKCCLRMKKRNDDNEKLHGSGEKFREN